MVRVARFSEASPFAASLPVEEPVVLDTPETCQDAQKFHHWLVDNLYMPLLQGSPSLRDVERAELWLQRKYHEFRLATTSEHRDFLSKSKTGHRCLYLVYLEAYGYLTEVRLKLPRKRRANHVQENQQIFG